MFPNVQLRLSTENYLLLAFFIPHFLSASEETDMTQVQEVGLALLKANKDYAIQSSMEFDLEKVVGVHLSIYLSIPLVLVLINLFRGSHIISM